MSLALNTSEARVNRSYKLNNKVRKINFLVLGEDMNVLPFGVFAVLYATVALVLTLAY
jgi:hypothetical protein